MGSGSDWGGGERRGYVRVDRGMKVSCQVVAGPETPAVGESENISRSGVMLISRTDLQIGTKVRMTIQGEQDGILLNIPGIVRRRDRLAVPGAPHYQLGIEFADIDDNQRHGILQLISRHVDKERRQYVRLRRRFAMFYKRGGFLSGWKAATALDIGCGGLMFTLREPPSLRDTLKLRIVTGPKEELKAEGRVVHVDPGNGLQPAAVHVTFVDPDGRVRRAVGEYVSRALNPEPSEAEETETDAAG